MAANTLPHVPCTVADTTRISDGDAAMIWRVASTPSITGMIKSMPRFGDRPHRPTHFPGHLMHDIEADPTSRNLRDRLFGRKRREKQKFHQLCFRQGSSHVDRGQLGAEDFLAQML